MKLFIVAVLILAAGQFGFSPLGLAQISNGKKAIALELHNLNAPLGYFLCGITAIKTAQLTACKLDVDTKYLEMNAVQMVLHLCTDYSADRTPGTGSAQCFAKAGSVLSLDRAKLDTCGDLGSNRAAGECYRIIFVQANQQASSPGDNPSTNGKTIRAEPARPNR